MNDVTQVQETASLVPDKEEKAHRILDIRSGAALLQSWTDKQRSDATNNILSAMGQQTIAPVDREFDSLPPAHQKLYELLTIKFAEALGLEITV